MYLRHQITNVKRSLLDEGIVQYLGITKEFLRGTGRILHGLCKKCGACDYKLRIATCSARA
jgi:hypothetical protein